MRNSLSLCFVHDIKQGIVGGWKKYAAALVVFIFLCSQEASIQHAALSYGAGIPDMTYGDYLFLLFRGTQIFHLGDTEFQVYVPWLLINILLAVIVSYYPFKDMDGYGQNLLIRSQKRGAYWISKCLWTAISVIVYYCIAYSVIGVFVLFTGNADIFPQESVQVLHNGVNVSTGLSHSGDVILLSIILPIITSVALSLFQLLLSLLLKPIISLMIIIGIHVSSIFICSDWLLGNFTMIMRNQQLIQADGVNTLNGIVISLVLSIGSVLISTLIFRKKDIYSH